jgi:hypothetical protein
MWTPTKRLLELQDDLEYRLTVRLVNFGKVMSVQVNILCPLYALEYMLNAKLGAFGQLHIRKCMDAIERDLVQTVPEVRPDNYALLGFLCRTLKVPHYRRFVFKSERVPTYFSAADSILDLFLANDAPDIPGLIQAIVCESAAVQRTLAVIDEKPEFYHFLTIMDDKTERRGPVELDCRGLDFLAYTDYACYDPVVLRFYSQFMHRLSPNVAMRIAGRQIRDLGQEEVTLHLTVDAERIVQQGLEILGIFGEGPFRYAISLLGGSEGSNKIDYFLAEVWNQVFLRQEFGIWEDTPSSEFIRLRKEPPPGTIMKLLGRFMAKLAIHKMPDDGISVEKVPDVEFYETVAADFLNKPGPGWREPQWRADFRRGFSEVLTWDYFLVLCKFMLALHDSDRPKYEQTYFNRITRPSR